VLFSHKLGVHSALFALALGLSLVSSLLTGDHMAWWHIATLLVGFAGLQLGYYARGWLRTLLQGLLLSVYIGLTCWVLVIAFTDANPRLTLWFSNENSLATNLVVLAVVCFVVRPLAWLPFVSVLAMLELVFLGSRLAFACLGLLLVVQLFYFKSALLKVVVGGFIVAGLALFFWPAPEQRNLLTFSNDLDQAVWRTSYALETTPLARVPDPQATTTAIQDYSYYKLSDPLRKEHLTLRLYTCAQINLHWFACQTTSRTSCVR
jgi:hypothetical protein